MTTYDYFFKVLLIGNKRVGKTSILNRYINDEYQETFSDNVGSDFYIKKEEVKDKKIVLQVWDMPRSGGLQPTMVNIY